MAAIDSRKQSVRSIQTRLFLLLLRAFALVVLLMVVFILALAGVFIGTATNNDPYFRSPLFAALETYYLVHGSWDGVVQVMFTGNAISSFPEFSPHWETAILLDKTGRVVVERGQSKTPLIGMVYSIKAGDEKFPLIVNGETVGTLVFEPAAFTVPTRLALRLLTPVVWLSVFPAILTLIIGMFLLRRVVAPLADVIAASRSVAAGDLSTRVEVRGPDDLRALTDSFNHMADAIERDALERREMLTDIAHELRTPLTVIRGRLEGIVDGIYTLEADAVTPALEETYLLERLVEDLRLLTLAESRQLHFERRPVNLAELSKRAADLFGAEAAEKKITIRLELEPDLPQITADSQRVEQVIGNLVSNALRYLPENGHVTIHTKRIAQGIEFAVSDNGPGVPAADLPHIFDRFWRGEKSRARVSGGAGLGLAIARQLIEAQGGTIKASAMSTGGLRVAFVFPLPESK